MKLEPCEINVWADKAGVEFTSHVKSYSLQKGFMNPSDHLRLTVWAERAKRNWLLDNVLLPKATVGFQLNGITLFRGNIDRVLIQGDGTVFLECNDYLSRLVDCDTDINQIIQDGDPLIKSLLTILRPAGIRNVQPSYNDARNSFIGYPVYTGAPVTDASKLKVRGLITPGANESLRESARKILDRQGLILLPTADRQTVALGAPEYRQSPSFQLYRFEDPTMSSKNNIEDGSVSQDWSHVRSTVIADCIGGDEASPRTSYKIDEAVFGPKAVHPIGKTQRAKRIAYGPKGNDPLFFNGRLLKNETPSEEVIYSLMRRRDRTSKTDKELRNWILKELSEGLKSILECEYTMRGHLQNGKLYCPDTIVDVQDEIGRVNEQLWVEEITFEKGEGDDQTTKLSCALPYSIILGPDMGKDN